MLKIIIESEKTFAVEACSEIEAYTRGRSEILKELKNFLFLQEQQKLCLKTTMLLMKNIQK